MYLIATIPGYPPAYQNPNLPPGRLKKLFEKSLPEGKSLPVDWYLYVVRYFTLSHKLMFLFPVDELK